MRDTVYYRPDRDDYLYIYWENIQDGKSGLDTITVSLSFNTSTCSLMQGLAYAFNKLNGGWTWTSFDYDSIMIYGNNAFSKDPYNPDIWKQYTMVDKFGK